MVNKALKIIFELDGVTIPLYVDAVDIPKKNTESWGELFEHALRLLKERKEVLKNN